MPSFLDSNQKSSRSTRSRARNNAKSRFAENRPVNPIFSQQQQQVNNRGRTCCRESVLPRSRSYGNRAAPTNNRATRFTDTIPARTIDDTNIVRNSNSRLFDDPQGVVDVELADLNRRQLDLNTSRANVPEENINMPLTTSRRNVGRKFFDDIGTSTVEPFER